MLSSLSALIKGYNPIKPFRLIVSLLKKMSLDDESPNHNTVSLVEKQEPTEENYAETSLHDNEYDELEIEEQKEEAEAPVSWKYMVWDIFWNATLSGATSFRGGVANLMARFCDSVNWLSYNDFLQVYLMSHVVPGPKPAQVAMGVGMLD